MYCSALIPCFSDHLFFVSDFRHLPVSCQVFPILYPLQLSHLLFSLLEACEILFTRLKRLDEFIPFPAIGSSCSLWRDPSMRFLVDSSASTTEAYFVLRFFSTLQVSLYFSRRVLQGIAAGIGTSNFLRAFFMVSLKILHQLDQWGKYHAIF